MLHTLQLSNTATGFLVMLVPLSVGILGYLRSMRLMSKDGSVLPAEWRDQTSRGTINHEWQPRV